MVNVFTIEKIRGTHHGKKAKKKQKFLFDKIFFSR